MGPREMLSMVVLVWLAAPVQAAEPTGVFGPQSPNAALLKEVLGPAGKLSFGGDRWLWSLTAGSAQGQWHDESPGTWSSDCSCEDTWTMSGATLRFKCRADCEKAYSMMFGRKPSEFWKETSSQSLRFLYLSPPLSLFVSEGQRWVVRPCDPMPASNPGCLATTEAPGLSLVQLIPGARDPALFAAVKAAVAAQPSVEGRLVFEGAPASKPREVSEVLFTAGQEAAAKRVAASLEPVIGKVEVKRWPGEWDYDVVVVVGAKKAL